VQSNKRLGIKCELLLLLALYTRKRTDVIEVGKLGRLQTSELYLGCTIFLHVIGLSVVVISLFVFALVIYLFFNIIENHLNE